MFTVRTEPSWKNRVTIPPRIPGARPVLFTETVTVVACVGDTVPEAGVTDSQLAPSSVTVDVAKDSANPVRFASATVCDSAAAAPGACAKMRPAGSTSGPGLLPEGRTFRVTETNSGVLLAVDDVIWISPLYWPGIRFAGFTETVRRGIADELGSDVPEVGVSASQLPPETVEPATLQFMAPTPPFRIAKLCDGGDPAFDTVVNVRAVWESRIVCVAALIVKVTGIASVVLAVTVISPVYVPVASPMGFAVTVSGTGIVPAVPESLCVTDSQLPPELVDADA
jgi:hypothetical protein